MLSRERVLQLRADYQAGLTISQLRRKYGHNVATIKRWIDPATPLPSPHKYQRAQNKAKTAAPVVAPDDPTPARTWLKAQRYVQLLPTPVATLLEQVAAQLDDKWGWGILNRHLKTLVAGIKLEPELPPTMVRNICAVIAEGLKLHPTNLATIDTNSSGRVPWGCVLLESCKVVVNAPQGPLAQMLVTCTLPHMGLSVGYVLPGPSFEGLVMVLKDLCVQLHGQPTQVLINSYEVAAAITRPERDDEASCWLGTCAGMFDDQGHARIFTTDFKNFQQALGAEVQIRNELPSSYAPERISLALLDPALQLSGDYTAFNEQLQVRTLYAQGLRREDLHEIGAIVARERKPQVAYKPYEPNVDPLEELDFDEDEEEFEPRPRVKPNPERDLASAELSLLVRLEYPDNAPPPKSPIMAWVQKHLPLPPFLLRTLRALKPLTSRVESYQAQSLQQAEVNQYGRISVGGNEYSVPGCAPGSTVVVALDWRYLSVRTVHNEEIVRYERCFGTGQYLLLWAVELERLVAQPAAFARSRVAAEFETEDVSLVVSYGFAAVQAVLTALAPCLHDNDIKALAALFHQSVQTALQNYDVEADDLIAVLCAQLQAAAPSHS